MVNLNQIITRDPTLYHHDCRYSLVSMVFVEGSTRNSRPTIPVIGRVALWVQERAQRSAKPGDDSWGTCARLAWRFHSSRHQAGSESKRSCLSCVSSVYTSELNSMTIQVCSRHSRFVLPQLVKGIALVPRKSDPKFERLESGSVASLDHRTRVLIVQFFVVRCPYTD